MLKNITIPKDVAERSTVRNPVAWHQASPKIQRCFKLEAKTNGKTVREMMKLEALKFRRSLLEECDSNSGFLERTNPTRALHINDDTESNRMAVDWIPTAVWDK